MRLRRSMASLSAGAARWLVRDCLRPWPVSPVYSRAVWRTGGRGDRCRCRYIRWRKSPPQSRLFVSSLFRFFSLVLVTGVGSWSRGQHHYATRRDSARNDPSDACVVELNREFETTTDIMAPVFPKLLILDSITVAVMDGTPGAAQQLRDPVSRCTTNADFRDQVHTKFTRRCGRRTGSVRSQHRGPGDCNHEERYQPAVGHGSHYPLAKRHSVRGSRFGSVFRYHEQQVAGLAILLAEDREGRVPTLQCQARQCEPSPLRSQHLLLRWAGGAVR